MIENCLDIMHRHPYSDWPTRVPEAVTGIVLHRFRMPNHMPDSAIDAYEVADFFEREPNWVGPRMPYHFVIPTDGRSQQALELDVIGFHAKGKNDDSVGIAVIGDFTRHEPTKEQVAATHSLCQALDAWIGAARIERHRPVDDPAKDCPGRHMDVEGMRHRVKENRQVLTPEDAERRLAELGVVV